MDTRALLLLLAPAALGSFVACGGKASNADVVASACDSDPECASEPEAGLPETFSSLDLRRLGDNPAPASGVAGCDPYEYESRIKVNLDQLIMILGSCEQDAATGVTSEGSTNVVLLAADVELIESAYERLRLSREEQCTRGAVITLDVSTDRKPEPELRLADADHSGCPLPGLELDSFVFGLEAFHAFLTSLRDR